MGNGDNCSVFIWFYLMSWSLTVPTFSMQPAPQLPQFLSCHSRLSQALGTSFDLPFSVGLLVPMPRISLLLFSPIILFMTVLTGVSWERAQGFDGPDVYKCLLPLIQISIPLFFVMFKAQFFFTLYLSVQRALVPLPLSFLNIYLWLLWIWLFSLETHVLCTKCPRETGVTYLKLSVRPIDWLHLGWL